MTEESKEASRSWWRLNRTVALVLQGLGVLALFSGIAASLYLTRFHRFRLTRPGNIETIGLTELSRAEILAVFSGDIGVNIFFVHLSERRRQLEQIPWVQRATVTRLLPDRIRVNIIERTPIAFVRQGQRIGLVDVYGVLLAMPTARMTLHHYSFPVITGLDVYDPLFARRARMAVYQHLISDLDSSGQHLSKQISEIDLTDPEDARVLMPEPGSDILAHFGDMQFLTRYQRYKAHITEWRKQYPRLAAVDLRYTNHVVLQIAAGKEMDGVSSGSQQYRREIIDLTP